MGTFTYHEMQEKRLYQKLPDHQEDWLGKLFISLPCEGIVDWEDICCKKNYKISDLESKG